MKRAIFSKEYSELESVRIQEFQFFVNLTIKNKCKVNYKDIKWWPAKESNLNFE